MTSTSNEHTEPQINPKTNLPQYIKSTFTILNSPNTKNSQSTLDSFKDYLAITLPQKESTEELFNVIKKFIFTSSETNQISKDPFILFPILYSSNPKQSTLYIDNILSIINQTIEDVNRPLFSFISQIFGQIINSLYHNSSPNNNILLSREEQDNLYRKLLNFCLNDIRLNKKNQQTCGCLYLTELIENCPLVKEKGYLKVLWETICAYIDDKLFFAKLEILNCIISLIFAAEKGFKPFANVALFKILDYLTDNDWMKRKLSLNVVYTLSFYCKEEIIPLKNYIIEFLNVLKNDKVDEVREVCLQTLKFLQENQDGYKDEPKPKIAQSAELSKRENTHSMKVLKVKKKPTTKKKPRSISMSNSVDNYNNTSGGFNKKKGKSISVSKGNSAKKMITTGNNYENEKMEKLKKERMILEQIEKDILQRRAKTPLLQNKKSQNGAGHKISIKPSHNENDRPKTPSLYIEEKDINGNAECEDKTQLHPIGSNESFKIKVGKSAEKSSEKKSENSMSNSISKSEIRENLEDKFVDEKTVLKSSKLSENKSNENINNTENISVNKKMNNRNLSNMPLQKTNTKEDNNSEEKQKWSSDTIRELSEQIKKLTSTQETILTSIANLTKTVSSNYSNLNLRVSKLESSLLDIIKTNSLSSNSNNSPNKESTIVDKNWQEILTELSNSNYTSALNLSLANDEYLLRTISKIPQNKIKTIDVNAIEDAISRLIFLILKGENLDIIIPFCVFLFQEKIKIKKMTKQNLKDGVDHMNKNRNNFIMNEDTVKKLDYLISYFASE